MKTFTANTGASKQNMLVYIWKMFTIQDFEERQNILIKHLLLVENTLLK